MLSTEKVIHARVHARSSSSVSSVALLVFLSSTLMAPATMRAVQAASSTAGVENDNNNGDGVHDIENYTKSLIRPDIQRPHEVDDYIWSFVPVLDMGRLRRVNKAWSSKLTSLMGRRKFGRRDVPENLDNQTFPAWIRQYPNIEYLDLSATRVSDVSALHSRCSSLRTLCLRSTSVADISALGSCRALEILDISNTQVSDISALGSCPALKALYLGCTKVRDISVLQGCTELQRIDLSWTDVGDISPLMSCPALYENIELRGTAVWAYSWAWAVWVWTWALALAWAWVWARGITRHQLPLEY